MNERCNSFEIVSFSSQKDFKCGKFQMMKLYLFTPSLRIDNRHIGKFESFHDLYYVILPLLFA